MPVSISQNAITKAPQTANNTPDYLDTATALARSLGETAVERDKAGGVARKELEQIRDSGLLKLIIPREYGGDGQPWSAALRVVREFAKADGSLAHLYGYHFLNLTIAQLEGSDAQFAELCRRTAAERLFWGNANNSLDDRLRGARQPDGTYLLNGVKGFTSGAAYADLLLISFRDEQNPDRVQRAVIPANRAGVTIHDDWDCIGQRQTASGTVSFTDVEVRPEELLLNDRQASPFSTIGPILAQLILTSVFIGSSQGAVAAASEYTRTQSRPWITSGVSRASEDRLVIRHYGEIGIHLEAAISLADKAAAKFDEAFAKGFSLTAEERGEVAYITAAANVFSGNTALDTTSRVFEAMGARSTASKYGFDRFWRNVRTHTLHNPAEYKIQTVGNYILNGQLPKPGFYS